MEINCCGDLSNVLLENYEGEWELYLFRSQNRKYKFKRVNIEEGYIRGLLVESIEKYNEKLIQTLGLVKYGEFEDENMLKVLSLEDEAISLMYQVFIDTLDNKMPKETVEESILLDRDADGYILRKKLENSKNLILGFKSKVVGKKKIKAFKETAEGYFLIDSNDFISFKDKIDFIIYEDNLYALDYRFEKVFYVGDFIRLKVLNILDNIEKTNRIAPSGMFGLRNVKQKRSLLKYNPDNLELISEKNVDILNDYGDFNLVGKQLQFEDDYSSKVMVKLLSGKLFFLDGKAWVGDKKELEKPILEEKVED
jgi:hypothetical protein